MRRFVLLGPLLVLGCAEDLAFVAWPDLGGARTWILSRVDANDEIVVQAGRVDEDVVRLPVASEPVELELRALVESLEDLGLTPGRVPREPNPSLGLPLPATPAVYTTRLDGAAAEPWTRSPGLPELREFRRVTDQQCLTFDIQVGTLPVDTRILWSVALDTTRALMGTERETMLVDLDAGTRFITVEATPPGPPLPALRSVLRDATGALWLGDQDGGLWRGTLRGDTLSLVRRVASSTLGPARILAGDPSDPEQQLYTLTTSGALAQLRGDRWHVRLHEPMATEEDPIVGLVWLARDEVVAGASSWTDLRHLHPDGTITDHDVLESEFGITALGQVGPRALAAGIAGGRVMRWDGTRWAMLGNSKSSLDIKVFAPLPGGFLYAGVFGYVGEWLERDVGFCPVGEGPLASATIKHILRLGERLFLVGDGARAADSTAYTVLTPQGP